MPNHNPDGQSQNTDKHRQQGEQGADARTGNRQSEQSTGSTGQRQHGNTPTDDRRPTTANGPNRTAMSSPAAHRGAAATHSSAPECYMGRDGTLRRPFRLIRWPGIGRA